LASKSTNFTVSWKLSSCSISLSFMIGKDTVLLPLSPVAPLT
jgi:hypothetical protein